jgi:hypothetical protein
MEAKVQTLRLKMPTGSGDPIAPEVSGGPWASVADERRHRPRLRLQLPVHLYPVAGEDPVVSLTQDISSNGFLCLTARTFDPGESLVCTIDCPSNGFGDFNKPFVILCRIKVVRCEHDAETGSYRTACRIEDYRCNYTKEANAA